VPGIEGGAIVADELESDLVALHVGSNHVLNGIGEAAVDFVGHEDGLADAAPGWVGSSQLALGQLAARWEARHSQHKLQVGGLGTHVAEALVVYSTNEDRSTGMLRSVQEQG
ncbi:RNA 2'-phosphotransferase, partial [Mycobacterium ahvazicum]